MKEKIISAAIEIAHESGLINLSRVELCERVGIPVGSFSYHTGCTFSDFLKRLPLVGDDTTMVVKKVRVNSGLRRAQILAVAVELSKTIERRKLTQNMIATRAGVSRALVSSHFSMKELRELVYAETT